MEARTRVREKKKTLTASWVCRHEYEVFESIADELGIGVSELYRVLVHVMMRMPTQKLVEIMQWYESRTCGAGGGLNPSFSVDVDTYEWVEKMAQELGVPRSRVARLPFALLSWLRS